MSASLGPVDHAALKANQLVIIALSAAAFIFDVPHLFR
jgi:hypothetical protein